MFLILWMRINLNKPELNHILMKTLFWLSGLLLAACSGADTQQEGGYQMGHAGAIKNFMHQGDVSAKAGLAQFKERPHFYGLGALAGLQGEILVWDGQPIVSLLCGIKLRL